MTDDAPAGFAAFVLARGDALHDAAYQLTGDHERAELLVAQALSAAWPRWARLGGDPEPFVRRAVADGLAPRWQRGVSREPPAALAVDGEPLADWSTPWVDPDDDPDRRAADRVAGALRLVTTRHRARLRMGAGAVVLLLVAAVAVVAKTMAPQSHPAQRSHPATQPATAPTPIRLELPAYYDGGRMTKSLTVDLSREGTTTLSFTPTVWGLDFAFRCPARTSGAAEFDIRVKGYLILGGRCSRTDPNGAFAQPGDVPVDGSSGDYGISNPAAQTFWQALGVQVGRPVTALVTVKQAGFAANPPPTLLVGVYQDVPFADYPVPSRPATAGPPAYTGPPISDPHAVSLPAGAADGTWTIQLPYRADLVVQGGVSAPGQVQVRVDGVLVGGYDSYEYAPGNGFVVGLGPPWPVGHRPPKPGQPVTITVTLSHFAEPYWKLALGHSTS